MECSPIEPLRTSQKLSFLDGNQLDNLKEATLDILENTGVQFPSEKALKIFAENGAEVDFDSQFGRDQGPIVHAERRAPRSEKRLWSDDECLYALLARRRL